jgi:hypothetical protein
MCNPLAAYQLWKMCRNNANDDYPRYWRAKALKGIEWVLKYAEFANRDFVREAKECLKEMNRFAQHFYPDGKYMPAYFDQMQRTAKEALDLIKNAAPQDEILRKLAEHYQYAANARPFGQINNSLFMNEINTLLQKAGMKPMPHGILDHVAQRLQPDAFVEYFIDEYKRTAL